jgi:S-disulfanyl-L-cysteine oxidoreductase SoxD
MYTSKVAVALLFLPLVAMAADESPGLGEPLSPEQVDAVSFTVMPDGEGLPTGSGTAKAGAAVYQQHCAACHGAEGEGTLNDRLVGGRGTIHSALPVKTVGSYWPYATTVFDYIRRAMPYTAPGSLSDDEVYALTAFLLFKNDIVAEDDVLDAQTLPKVRMPNRDNFDWAWQP